MFDIKTLSVKSNPLWHESPSGNNHLQQYHQALNKFKSTVLKGVVSRLMRRVLNRPQQLYDLNALKSGLRLRGSFYSGIQAVPVRSIIGTEGRTADFDIDFHPMSGTEHQRWVNVALAYLSGQPLEPVQLIQVGDAYFVRDGHHRVSVSRAFGQVAVDAEVISWNVAAPLTWLFENSPVSRGVFGVSTSDGIGGIVCTA